MREFGVYKNLTNEEYHADKEFISRSAILDFSRSAYTYWAKHINPNRPKKDATPAMILGSAFHKFVLEPDDFLNEFVFAPEPVTLKYSGREAYDEYKKELEICESSNKIILSHDVGNTIIDMREVLNNNKDAMNLICDSRIENSFFWQDKQSGLLLKSRPDILHDNIIVDLKTTSDASPRAFQSEMVKYGYHVQFAMIRDAVEAIEGRKISNFINLVIETKYPYNTAIYIIDEFAVNAGQDKYKQICIDMQKAKEENEYNDYGIQQIGLPKWAT